MPLVVGKRLMSNREQLSKLSMKQLVAYEKALNEFMVSNSPMIAQTLKMVWQEIEWRKSVNQ
jgi:hypothetical protein